MGGFYRDGTSNATHGAAGGNRQAVQQPADQVAFANGTVITEKSRKRRRGKKKKRHGGKGASDGGDGLVTCEGGDGMESGSDVAHGEVAIGEEQNGHLTGGGSYGAEAKGDGYPEGGAVQHVGDTNSHDDTGSSPKERQMISPDDWQDADDAIPISMEQLINGSIEPSTRDSNRNAVATWLNTYTSAHSTSLSLPHRLLVIDHILNNRFPGTDPAWPSTLRQTIWRAVLRSSHFWINPDTGKTINKILPVHRPDGIYENDFKVFLMCAAERADRIGRDLPTEEHVKMIESAIRTFFFNVEKAGLRNELECLGFVLMFDEEHRRVLGFDDLRERIRWAFEGRKVDWEGCEILRARKVKVNTTAMKAVMKIWRDAKAAL